MPSKSHHTPQSTPVAHPPGTPGTPSSSSTHSKSKGGDKSSKRGKSKTDKTKKRERKSYEGTKGLGPAALKRLARRSGIRIISRSMLEHISSILDSIVSGVLETSKECVDVRKQKTVQSDDVAHAFDHIGFPIIGMK